MGWYGNDVEAKHFLGKTFVSVEKQGDDEIHFETDNGEHYKMYHSQDCCESVSIEDICGDLSDLVGSPITIAEKRSSDEPSDSVKAERAKARAERGLPPIGKAKKARKKYVSKKAKEMSATRYLMRDKAMEYIQTAKDQVKKHQAATIIWPENVKVQRIPTPEDVRFKAAPGYIGEFVREMKERMAA